MSFDWEKKVMDVAQLQRELASKRSQTIVFTNGCFDLLHVGHLQTLREARRQGDLLIVGVNSDRSVRALKGERRPLTPQRERAEILAALECVDYVTVFDEDTPLEVLGSLRPNVHVKGGDYLPEDLPETPLVRSFGGRVHITGLVPGRSTTILEQSL